MCPSGATCLPMLLKYSLKPFAYIYIYKVFSKSDLCHRFQQNTLSMGVKVGWYRGSHPRIVSLDNKVVWILKPICCIILKLLRYTE